MPLFRITRPFAASLLAWFGFAAGARAAELPVAADAHVNSTQPSTNYGQLSNLYVGNGNTTFLQFDLSGLPNGILASQISAAKITVFVNRVNTAGLASVAAVTSGWSEGTVNYGTMPSVSSTVTTTFMPGVAGAYVTFDITALVSVHYSYVQNGNTDLGNNPSLAGVPYTVTSIRSLRVAPLITFSLPLQEVKALGSAPEGRRRPVSTRRRSFPSQSIAIPRSRSMLPIRRP